MAKDLTERLATKIIEVQFDEEACRDVLIEAFCQELLFEALAEIDSLRRRVAKLEEGQIPTTSHSTRRAA
jgi:hypothetical protein